MSEMNTDSTFGTIIPLRDPESYHEFNTLKEADDWGFENYAEWGKAHKAIYSQITQFDRTFQPIYDPVAQYLGWKSTAINDYLRTESESTSRSDVSHIQMLISHLLIAMSSAPLLSQSIVAYRQVSKETAEKIIELNKKAECPYTEKGFMSTSLHRDSCLTSCGNQSYMLKLFIDCSAIPIHSIYANVIAYRPEAELLLQPNLHLQLVKEPYKDHATGKQIVECRLFSLSTVNHAACQKIN